MRKAIIIGAGIAGIATAIRLANKGYEVTVFEANNYAGGKLSRFKQGKYAFDAGPSLFTMPQYVDELFILSNRNPKDYFNYKKLDDICNYFWEDGTKITSFSDLDRFAEEVQRKTKSSKEEVFKYFKKSKEIYEITNSVFLERSLHKLKTYLRKQTAYSFLRFLKIDAFKTMFKANESFFSDPKMQQFANRYATYNGSNPYQAPATLNVIPHLEQHFGAYFPAGGMYEITLSLVKLAEEIGVNFIFNTKVDEISVKGKKSNGVIINQKHFFADKVISNMDVFFTYKKLLSKQKQPKLIQNQERSSSALIFYWGVKTQFQQLGLHNILFAENYKKEFDTIFKKKDISEDPTIYINISSKINKDDAPAGCENWFTMINVPNNTGQNWDELIASARKNIIKKINKNFNVEIENFIENESVLDPRSIESKTSSYQGSLYGTSSNNQFAAFLRHANFSSKIRNLYFVGGSVHPGGGIPLSLLSAKIVDNMIEP